MHQDVAGSDGGEDISRLILVGRDETRRCDRRPRRRLEIRPVQVRDLPQTREVEHAPDLVAILRGQAKPAQEECPRRLRHGPLHFKPDRLAEAAPTKLFLDRHQEVVRVILFEGQVGVAGHPEEVVLDDLHAGEQRVQVGLDDLVDEHEMGRFHLQEARQDLGHFDPREVGLARLWIAQADRDRKAQGRDVREGMAGVHRERREDREDLVEEPLTKDLVVFGDGRVLDDLDALGGQFAPHRQVDRRLVRHEAEDLGADGG